MAAGSQVQLAADWAACHGPCLRLSMLCCLFPNPVTKWQLPLSVCMLLTSPCRQQHRLHYQQCHWQWFVLEPLYTVRVWVPRHQPAATLATGIASSCGSAARYRELVSFLQRCSQDAKLHADWLLVHTCGCLVGSTSSLRLMVKRARCLALRSIQQNWHDAQQVYDC